MKKLTLKILNNTWGLLAFALISGMAYFSVIYRFVLSHTAVGGRLLALFLLPVVVCGAALVIVKGIKQCLSDGRENMAVTVFCLHVLFIVMCAVAVIAAIAY